MELNEVFELIGFEVPQEGEVKLEDVRSHVNSTFVPTSQIAQRRDLIDPIIGKAVGSRLGKLETNYIKGLKELGVEVTHSEFEGKGIEELIAGGLDRVKGLIAEKSKGGKPNEELEKKIQALTGERDTFQKSVEEWQGKYTGLESSIEQEKIKAIQNTAIKGAFEKVKYPTGTNDVTKKGLQSMFLDNYDTEIDGDSVYVIHKVGENKGSRVQHPKNAAKLMTVEDAVIDFAKSQELWSDSPHDGKGTRTTTPKTTARRTVDDPSRKVRKAAPGFLDAGLG